MLANIECGMTDTLLYFQVPYSLPLKKAWFLDGGLQARSLDLTVSEQDNDSDVCVQTLQHSCHHCHLKKKLFCICNRFLMSCQ